MISRRRASTFLLGLVLLAGDYPAGHTVEEISLTLGGIEGAGWSLEGVEARLVWLDGNTAALRLDAAKAVFPEPLGSVSDLRGVCPQGSITPEKITCRDGEFRLGAGYLGAQRLRLDFDYRFDTGRLVLAMDNLRVDGGVVSAKAELESGGLEPDSTGKRAATACGVGATGGCGRVAGVSVGARRD